MLPLFTSEPSLFLAARRATSSAEVLEGSQRGAAQRGRRPGGRQVLCPGGVSRRLHVAVDK